MTRILSNRPPRSIVLAAGLRSPWAKAGGAFAGEDAGHLGARVLRELLARTALPLDEVDEVVVGCVGQPHDQANVGRVIALRAGLPRSVPARTVARNCASGMEAVTSAANSILSGEGELFLCLGVEVMSAYPLTYKPAAVEIFGRLARARTPLQRLAALARFRPAHFAPTLALMEGLTDPVSGLIMGRTAELLAREWSLTRREADTFAAESHRRAAAARDRGRMKREILPHLGLGSREGASALVADDGIRDGQTVEALSKLKPYFEKPDGMVTVGNACGITDGAAALIVTSEERARSLGLAPLARLRAWAWAGLDPARMGLGPVYASAFALERAGCTLRDVGAIEINEAFAAQVLACERAFASERFARQELGRSGAVGELDMGRTNKNGGAIALGHPVGATGARLLLTLAHELSVSDCELGLATLCIGGGQGGAVVLERCAP